MPRPSTEPLTLEVLSVRFLHLAPRDYVVQVATDGVYMRRKGTREWYGPATWEQILQCAARTSARKVSDDPAREMAVGS